MHSFGIYLKKIKFNLGYLETYRLLKFILLYYIIMFYNSDTKLLNFPLFS